MGFYPTHSNTKKNTRINRNLGGHKLNLNLSKTLSISIGEYIIYTGKIYKVQLATSSVKIPILPENFNGLKDVEVYISGKFYKYT